MQSWTERTVKILKLALEFRSTFDERDRKRRNEISIVSFLSMIILDNRFSNLG